MGLLATMAVLAGALPLQASTLPADETANGQTVRELSARVPIPITQVSASVTRPAGKAVWFSSDGQLAYIPTKLNQGFEQLAAVRLADGEEVARVALQPPAYVGLGGNSGNSDQGDPGFGAVDPSSGDLVLAYSNFAPPLPLIPGTGPANSNAQGVSREETCAGLYNLCFSGLHVLDGQTLEPARERIPYKAVRADSVQAAPALRAMSIWPVESGTKALLLVEEVPHEVHGVAGDQEARGLYSTTLAYAVQVDLQTGVQEWSVRVDGCRGSREPRSQDGERGYDSVAQRPHPAAIFGVTAGSGPHSVVAACHSGTSAVGTVVQIPLDQDGRPAMTPVAPAGDQGAQAVDALESGDPSTDSTDYVRADLQQRAFFGPDKVTEILADQVSGRVLLRVVDGDADVWWVFDSTRMQLLGTIGIGSAVPRSTMSGLDPVTGRLYTLARPREGSKGGLFIADIRRTPVPQALVFEGLASVFPRNGDTVEDSRVPLHVRPGGTDRPALILVSDRGDPSAARSFRILEDRVPLALRSDADDEYAGRTLDLDEVEGVTQAALDGSARGYGARVLLVGGLDAAARVGPVDGPGNLWQIQDTSILRDQFDLAFEATGFPRSPCTQANRDVVIGFVGPDSHAVVDGAGARGSAEPIVVDSATRADGEAAISRCGSVFEASSDWEQIWQKALFSGPPTEEPKLPWMLGDGAAECLSSDSSPSDSVGDPVANLYAAGVACTEDEASGYAYARGVEMEGVRIGEALSSFRIYRDPGRGIVSRVESVARGVGIPGVLRIDTVRGVAESWANGRRQPVDRADREPGYDPNCDPERSAGTCFRRHLVGVWTPGYSCGPCLQEQEQVERISRGMGANASIRLRDPEPRLATGAANGFIAAITKPFEERFADLVLNNDLLQTVLPTLEIVRYAPPNRLLPPGGGPRGRQIIQLAGVEVASSYGIECLLVYDEAANTCAEPAEAPGSIQVSLSDTEGKPLAGGAFEVRADVDADGVLGLRDTLLPDGACVTADDGVGTCMFENLQPGTYLVSQVAAPPGYAKTAEPWVSEVASGERRTVAFTNVSNVSTIDLKATDEHGAPISGATFAAYADADSDGKVAPDAQPAAECTTDDQGVCTMRVPAGSYVLVQTAAPGGLEGIEPVPFTFASGGQVASVSVVNYPPAAPEQPAPAAAPIDYTPPVDSAPPVESVTDFTPVADSPVIEEPAVSVPERIGGTVTQVIRAPGDALRLLARDPKQAVAWIAALALFILAAMAVRRRWQAMALLEQ